MKYLRAVVEKSTSKNISLIAGNTLNYKGHNVIRNDKREGMKTLIDWSISSQAPEMEKVQRPVLSDVVLKQERNGRYLNTKCVGNDMVLSLVRARASKEGDYVASNSKNLCEYKQPVCLQLEHGRQ